MPKKIAASKKRKVSSKSNTSKSKAKSSSKSNAKSSSKSNAKSSTGTRQKPVSAFLQKLFQIVSNEAPYCLWNQEGTTLMVSSPDTFSAKVLPKYFKSSNFSSFVRQLHFYGFRKTDKDKNSWEFSHANFLRGQPEQLSLISRKTCSDYSGGSTSNTGEIENLKKDVVELKKQLLETRSCLLYSNAIILQMTKEGRFQNKLFEIANDLVLHPFKERPEAFPNMSTSDMANGMTSRISCSNLSFGNIGTQDTFTTFGNLFPQESFGRQPSEGPQPPAGRVGGAQNPVGVPESGHLDILIDNVLNAMLKQQRGGNKIRSVSDARDEAGNGRPGKKQRLADNGANGGGENDRNSNGGSNGRDEAAETNRGNGMLPQEQVRQLLCAVAGANPHFSAPMPKPMQFKPPHFVAPNNGEGSPQQQNWSLSNLYANTRQSSISQDLLDVVSNEKAAAGGN
jgi:hypothetical protein